MRDYLTVKELSKLLGISDHSIRYYDREGLIKPAKTSDAGYRLYDLNNVYLLSSIMLLRDSEIPIKQIKELIKNYTKQNHVELLKQSEQQLAEQIEQLKSTRNQIKKDIDLIIKSDKFEHGFFYRNMQKRQLKIVKRNSFGIDYSAKEIFDIFIQSGIDLSQMYKDDMIYYLTEDDISYCILDKDNHYTLEAIECKKGKYLCCKYIEEDDSTTEKQIEKFFEYCMENKIETEGDMLMVVSVRSSMGNEFGYMYELQMKLI